LHKQRRKHRITQYSMLMTYVDKHGI
jgi:hypothetical protein